jgi:hypothetical protein
MIDTFLVKLGLKRRNLFLQFRRLGGIRFGFGQLALQYTRFLIQIGSHILGCFEERFPFLFELLVLLFAHWVIVSRTTNTSMVPTLAMVAHSTAPAHAAMGKSVDGKSNDGHRSDCNDDRFNVTHGINPPLTGDWNRCFSSFNLRIPRGKRHAACREALKSFLNYL